MIPTNNSERTIETCLRSIADQDVPANEVIVVDKHSSDHTIEIASLFGAHIIQSTAGRSKARNIGFRASRFAAVCFVDADMELSHGIIKECLEGMKAFDALVIPEISKGVGFWAECKTLERRTYMGDNTLEAARCFRRDALDRLKGYDGSLVAGEDWDLQNRTNSMGFATGKIKAQITHNEGRLKLATLMRKKHFYGKTIGRYIDRNPTASISQVNPIYRIINPAMRVMPHDPKHGSGILLMKSLEFAAAGIGYISKTASPHEDEKIITGQQ